MRKIVFILFIGTFLFTLNLAFYVLSEDYRFFIKKIKYSDTIVYDSTTAIDDSDTEILEISDTPGNVPIQKEEEVVQGDSEKLEVQNFTFLEELKKWKQEEVRELVLSKVEKDFLKLFQKYELQKLTKHASLFDITREYPDNYFEYYSKDIALYIFATKSYSDVYDIFEVLSEELPYNIKEVNNFGQASFYLNLKEVYTDDFVRLIFQYENRAFWLKIRKDVYNEVKQILDPLKSQG